MFDLKTFAAKAEDYAKNKVPYQHRSASRFGCDCTGLPIGILREMGFASSYKMRQYKRDWFRHREDNHVKEELKKFGDEIPKNQRQQGDILVFVFAGNPAHIGILIRPGIFVHCLETEGTVCFGVLGGSDSQWGSRLDSVFRLNEEKMIKWSK